MPDKNGCKNNEPLDERWAQAFRKDDKQVATLLSNMLDGFAYCQIIIEEGRPVDFEFLDVNKAFKVIIQKKRSEVIGKRAAEVNAGFISDRVDWIGIFARVALEGVSITFETIY
jgi:PAS domain-containing protein